MSDQIKSMSQVERNLRRTVAIELLKEDGVSNAIELVDLHQATSLLEKDNDAVIRDPITGRDFTALALMDQLQSEGKDRLGREFSLRRGYSGEQIDQFERYLSAYGTAHDAGASHDDLAYALGVSDGQLGDPAELQLRVSASKSALPIYERSHQERVDAFLNTALEVLHLDPAEAEACAYEAGRFGLPMSDRLLPYPTLTTEYSRGGIDVAADRKAGEQATMAAPTSEDLSAAALLSNTSVHDRDLTMSDQLDLSGESLRAEMRKALQALNDMEEGRAPRYDSADRERFASLAKAAVQETASPGLAASLSQSHQLAQGIVNSMAAVDGPKADNVFFGSTLSKTYASAQRWQAHVARHQDRPSLQSLLNARADLVSAVDRQALALHQAQRSESAAFQEKGSAPDGVDKYQSALQEKKQATERFVEAVSALREFRAAPTVDPQLRRAFQDLEALELVVSKTERSIRDAASAGMQPDEHDHRELRHNQMALKAFLQLHDATIPMNLPANAERRQDRQDDRATTAHRM